MDIKKIKFSPKAGMSVAYELIENGVSNSYTKTSEAIPTMACQNALQALKPHLLALTEFGSYYKEDSVVTPEQEAIRKTFVVTGISLSGDGDEEKVVITGKKVLSSGKAIALNSPLQSLWNTDSYEWSGNLQSCVSELIEQGEKYIGGECQPTPKNEEIPFPKAEELSDKVEDMVGVEEDL